MLCTALFNLGETSVSRRHKTLLQSLRVGYPSPIALPTGLAVKLCKQATGCIASVTLAAKVSRVNGLEERTHLHLVGGVVL